MTGIYMDRHMHGDSCLFYGQHLYDRCLAIPALHRQDQADRYTRGASVLTHELGRCAAVEIFLQRWVDQPTLAPVEAKP